ncbi:MAG: caspase family protein [Spirosomataceae bacterium]
MKTFRNTTLLLGLLLTVISVQAQQSAGLVIGISHYQELDTLQFADRDAVAFAEFLKTQQVPEDNIKLFLNENATRFNIVDELYNTTQSLKKGDRFYFYFGGHGDLEAKIGYENSLLLLYNSFKKNYFQGNEYLQLSELKTWFRELSKKGIEVIFIADACHSGGLIGGKEGNSKTQKALQESWEGITKILSSKADEFSLEGKQWGGGRGLFSYHLVNGLIGRADGNGDQKVSLGELSKYLQEKVVGEAAPNVQTPVVLGNSKQQVSVVSKAAMKGLAEAEKRQIPILTEVNIKGGEEREALLISKLDTTLTSTFNKLIQAMNEKRLNTFDNEKDYALLHYRKLVAEKVPDYLLIRIKRKLGEALMERELLLMRNVREKGDVRINRMGNNLELAMSNLQETMNLLGSSHYLYKFLEARVLVLQSQILPKQRSKITDNESIDKNLKDLKIYYTNLYAYRKQLLIKAFQLEPAMISTYALLAACYQESQRYRESNKNTVTMLDSAIFYQQKVIELIPNHQFANFNLGLMYQRIYQENPQNPSLRNQAIEYYEKAIALDATYREAYLFLSELYRGDDVNDPQHDYVKAIPCYEKLFQLSEQKDLKNQQTDKNYISKMSSAGPNPIKANFMEMMANLISLQKLYQLTGNNTLLAAYKAKLQQKIEQSNSWPGYWGVTIVQFNSIAWSEDENDAKLALEWLQKAFEKLEEAAKSASNDEKITLNLYHREALKSMGVVHRMLKNYEEAEKYFLKAIAYPTPEQVKGKLKLTGSSSFIAKGRLLSTLNGIQIMGNSYHYRLDAFEELFLMKLEQNKVEEAYSWLDKAFENSAAEFGNDISGEPFEHAILSSCANLDQARFKTLKAKYFPPIEKK